jgi:DNA repair protein RadC
MLDKKRRSQSGLAEATPHYLGHRERLRDRFRGAGAGALPRRDVKPLAKSLLEKFGSFAEVIGSSLDLSPPCECAPDDGQVRRHGHG